MVGGSKKLKQPKLKNNKKFFKPKKVKMFVHAEINPQTMGWENFMTEMAETFGKSHGKNGWRGCSRPMETDDGTEWNRNVNLRRFPTKPEDLHVKLDGNKLVLSGKSEVEKDQCGFKVFSTHVWTKEIEIPENIKPETIKAKMSPENILKITAERKDDHNIDIETPNLD